MKVRQARHGVRWGDQGRANRALSQFRVGHCVWCRVTISGGGPAVFLSPMAGGSLGLPLGGGPGAAPILAEVGVFTLDGASGKGRYLAGGDPTGCWVSSWGEHRDHLPQLRAAGYREGC